tara:strand:- start:93 stop:344 length:252 start_codon:yes stop_codon:yes gene_type:complete
MRKPRTIKEELPIYWATFIAYGDASGLEDKEEELINETLEYLELSNCEFVDVSDDYYFSSGRSDLPNLLAGDFTTYTFIKFTD